jgi:hypothetical protein
MTQQTTIHDLRNLILSYHSLITIETVEEERVWALLTDVAGEARLPLYQWSQSRGLGLGVHPPLLETQEPLAALRHISASEGDAIYQLNDLTCHLDQAAVARELRELAQKLTSTRSAIVITGDPIEMPRDLASLAIGYPLQLPGDDELREVVRGVVESIGARQRVSVDLDRDEARRVVKALAGLTLNQARQVVAGVIVNDGRLTGSDIENIIRTKGEMISRERLLEFIPPQSNRFQLGGFGRLKQWLDDARIGFSPEARALNLEAPKGLLLVGVQGCGKSLAAKFIASQWQLPLLKLDAARLYDKFVGETENNFRRATSVAEAMAPAVLWIDEIEKAFASGGSGESDGGLSQRLLGSFLSWLQEKKAEVFVVGAANDLGRLPPELLRKGRFDEIFFVDLPDASERQEIWTIHLALRRQDPAAFDLGDLVADSEGFSGAEIEQAIVAALYAALHHRESLTTQLLKRSLSSTVPLSVSRREDVERLRQQAEGRFTPVR